MQFIKALCSYIIYHRLNKYVPSAVLIPKSLHKDGKNLRTETEENASKIVGKPTILMRNFYSMPKFGESLINRNR